MTPIRFSSLAEVIWAWMSKSVRSGNGERCFLDGRELLAVANTPTISDHRIEFFNGGGGLERNGVE